MKSKTTTIWFVLAIALAAAVWFVQKHFEPVAPVSQNLLAGFRSADIDALQIIPAGQREISLDRTNKNWFLLKPVAYPAQAAAVENFLDALEKLTPSLRLTAAELQHKNSDEEFGFDNPQFRLDLAAGEQNWHLLVGNKTAPGDGVYVRIVGSADVFITAIDWLQFLPRDAGVWRDTSLVDSGETIDWLIITNGAKSIELRCDPTNHLWRMIRPLPARADSAFITTALQQLRAAKISSFVTDDAKTDLATFGLQPAEFDLWLGHGTNLLGAIHAGKESAENAGQIFARREGWNSVVTVPKESLQAWRGGVNDFRDPHLLEITAPVAEIEVTGQNDFTLRQNGGSWNVVGEKFPVDLDNVKEFVRLLADLRATDFVKDVATAADLQSFGLAPTNSRTITLRSAGDSNSVIAQLIFGATETNRIFVKRSDEVFVYALSLNDVNRLPIAGWQFRDRQLWDFSVTNVAQITLHQNGKTRQFLREGFNKWSLSAGSQGIADPVGLEETTKQFGTLAATWWIARNFSEAEGEKNFGLNTNNLQITFELKTGEKMSVDLGTPLQSQTALAATSLDGERWAFVFPPAIYQLVTAYLTIPPGPP